MEKKLEHAKYAAAKKRYAKRTVPEKKSGGTDDVMASDLSPERFPL